MAVPPASHVPGPDHDVNHSNQAERPQRHDTTTPDDWEGQSQSMDARTDNTADHRQTGVSSNNPVVADIMRTPSIHENGPPATNGETLNSNAVAEPTLEKAINRRLNAAVLLQRSAWRWTLAAFTIASYCITVCYAFGTTSLRYLSIATLGPSNSLLVLRTLSEVTSVSFVLFINICTERALWMLVSRQCGMLLSSFLALSPDSGLWGWLNLIVGNARGGRKLSWLQLILIIIPPAMAVALLSQVNTRLYFDDHANFPIAAGIGNFDARYALEYAQVAATYMTSDFAALLETNEIAWSVPVVDSTNSDCDASDFFSSRACPSGYFLHGGLRLVTPWPTENATLQSVPIYTMHSVRGLQLDFTNLEPGARFQGDRDCIVLGTDNDAIQICISQYTSNAVNAKYVSCTSSSCLEDKSWTASTGWTATMHTYTRHATVRSFRANLSTVSVSDFSAPTEYPLLAADMLSVYNTTLNAKTTLSALIEAAGQFVSFVSSYLYVAQTSSPTAAQAGLKLRNLMAMPLYYFQPTYMSPYTAVPSPDRVLEILPRDQDLYTTASLSTAYYGLAVAAWSVWLYTFVMGLLLVCCLVVMVLSTMPKTAGGIPETAAWPFVDLVAHCFVVDSHNAKEAGQQGGEGMQSAARKVRGEKALRAKAKVMGEFRVTLDTAYI